MSGFLFNDPRILLKVCKMVMREKEGGIISFMKG